MHICCDTSLRVLLCMRASSRMALCSVLQFGSPYITGTAAASKLAYIDTACNSVCHSLSYACTSVFHTLGKTNLSFTRWNQRTLPFLSLVPVQIMLLVLSGYSSFQLPNRPSIHLYSCAYDAYQYQSFLCKLSRAAGKAGKP